MAPKTQTLGFQGGKARTSLRGKKAAVKPTPARKVSEEVKVTFSAEEIKAVEGLEELDVDDPRWDGLYKDTVKQKGIHVEHENRVERILRCFDLDSTYGPCIGLTRLERWERASSLEQDPPLEIREILQTKQGQLQYKHSVFASHGL